MFSGSRWCQTINLSHDLLSGEVLIKLHIRWITNLAISQHQPSDPIESTESSSSRRVSASCKTIRRDRFDQPLSHKVLQRPSQHSLDRHAYSTQTGQLALTRAKRQKLESVLKNSGARQSLVTGGRHVDDLPPRAPLAQPSSTAGARVLLKRNQEIGIGGDEQLRWDRMVNLIASIFPQPKVSEGEEVWLSLQALVALSGTPRPNSWVIHVRGGCEIEVTDKRCSRGVSMRILLRGTTRAVSLAKEYLAWVEDTLMRRGVGCPNAADFESISDQESCHQKPMTLPNSGNAIRRVHAEGKNHFTEALQYRADDVPRPKVWNVRSFLHHVENLTRTRIPRFMERELYRARADHHNLAIANVLCFLFTDPTTAPFASTVALNVAFAFLAKHPELSAQLKQLYASCHHLRLTLQSQTYCYMLRATMFWKMPEFLSVLDDLHSEGHAPDAMVWLVLLEHASSPNKKNLLVRRMRQRGLLQDASANGSAAAELFGATMDGMQRDELKTGELIASIDTRFGKQWMTRSSVSRALQCCARKRTTGLAVMIIKEAQQRRVKFDSTAIAATLLLLQRQGGLRASLNLLRSHFVGTIGRDDRMIIPIIFLTAWKCRFYNVCRVLWRYSATLGSITRKMQTVVKRSLQQKSDVLNEGEDHNSPPRLGQEWRQRAGKVIVGIDLDIEKSGSFFTLGDESKVSDSSGPTAWPARNSCNHMARDKQISLAKVMLQRDLEAWKYFSPPRSARLFDLLSEAYNRDVQWKREGIGLDRGGKSTHWMIENAVNVPLIRRELSSPTQISFAEQ